MFSKQNSTSLPRQIAFLASALMLILISQTTQASFIRLNRRANDNTVTTDAAANSDTTNTGAGTGSGLGAGPIAGIVCAAAVVVGAVGLLLYRRMQNQSRPTHGGRVAKVVAMRGAGAMNLQGRMAVLPDDDDFHIGTQQGVISYTSSQLEKPARAARPISWYKAREAGVSPLHIQAMTRAGPNEYSVEDTDVIQLHSPSNQGALQTPMVGNVAHPQLGNSEVQIVVESAGGSVGRPLPPAPSQQQRRSSPLQHQPLETPLDGPGGDHLSVGVATPGHISDVEWDSDEDEPTAELGSNAELARPLEQLRRTPSAKFIQDTGADVNPNDPNMPTHPRLFILTPGRDGLQGLYQPECWSRTTFQLRLLCEGAAADFADAHLTEEHGIAIRDPNDFLRHASRYIAQTAEALIARDDTAFEQAEVFASSSEAGEYLELLADTLRAWYSDQLVTLEEAAAEGHEVDEELLKDLRTQRDDSASSAKQELERFLTKYDSNHWNGGLRAVKGSSGVRWLCASCAAKV